MPQTCTVCRHPNLADIDRAILRGDSLRDMARQYSLSKDAVARHKAHLPNTLVKAREAQVVARADSLLDQVRHQEALFDELDQSAKVIQERAIGEKDRRGALEAISVRGNLSHKRRWYMELFGRITGELPDSNGAGVTVNLVRVLSVPRIGETLESFNAAPISSQCQREERDCEEGNDIDHSGNKSRPFAISRITTND